MRIKNDFMRFIKRKEGAMSFYETLLMMGIIILVAVILLVAYGAFNDVGKAALSKIKNIFGFLG